MTAVLLDRPRVENGIRKYEIWMAEMREGKGSEQTGTRPVAVLQNEIGNRYAPTVLVAPLTSSTSKKNIPTHVDVKASGFGLMRDSKILCEQIVTLDKTRLKHKICDLTERERANVDVALMVSFGLKLA